MKLMIIVKYVLLNSSFKYHDINYIKLIYNFSFSTSDLRSFYYRCPLNNDTAAVLLIENSIPIAQRDRLFVHMSIDRA